LFKGNGAMLAAYDRQVDKQQDKNGSVKDDPKPDVHG
jgi:hypothetical protein